MEFPPFEPNISDGRWVVEASRDVPPSLVMSFERNRSVDEPARGILLAMYGALVAIGALGNALVVLAVARKPGMRTARNLLIVNLAVADALVCVVGTPLTLAELLTKHWPLPAYPVLCKATGTLQATSIFVSTISITAIALDRYQVIVYPTRPALRAAGAAGVMLSIWLIALALASPLFIFRTLRTHRVGLKGFSTISFCLEEWPIPRGRAIYSAASLVVQYAVPAVVVIAAHARIHSRLRTAIAGRKRTRARSRRRTPALLAAIAVTYVVSWLPLNVFNLVADLSEMPLMEHQAMLVTYAACHMIGMSSACTNPLLYGWLNENFRKEFEEMLCCWCPILKKDGRSNRMVSAATKKQADTELTVLAPLDNGRGGEGAK